METEETIEINGELGAAVTAPRTGRGIAIVGRMS